MQEKEIKQAEFHIVVKRQMVEPENIVQSGFAIVGKAEQPNCNCPKCIQERGK